MEKILDPAFRNFLGGRRCIKCARTPVQLHHEGIILPFTGNKKNHLDYQAFPMCAECHIGIRHGKGYKYFWGDESLLIPATAALRQLIEYRDKVMSLAGYDDEDSYEQACTDIDEIIEYLEHGVKNGTF